MSSSILLCIVGELAGGWSKAVGVDVNDMQQVSGDTQHLTPDNKNLW